MSLLTKHYKIAIYIGLFLWWLTLLSLPSFIPSYQGIIIHQARLVTKTILPLLGLLSLPFAIKKKDCYDTLLAILLIAAFPISKTLTPFIGLTF